MHSGRFTDPFRYIPSKEVIQASREVISFIDNHCRQLFSEGKMLGVLIVRIDRQDSGHADAVTPVHPLGNGYGFLAAFSGTVDGRATLPYFVPPVFDLTVPDGYFRKKEAQIVLINEEIASITGSQEYLSARKAYSDALAARENGTSRLRMEIAEARRLRKEKRKCIGTSDSIAAAALDRESQFWKAELRRLVRKHDDAVRAAKDRIDTFDNGIAALKARRQTMSDELQQWIFRQYIVSNASGAKADIASIFSRQGLTPPGGTGDCAAPKLLQYAFSHSLEPVSMGEFWYGTPPASSVRAHGHFYPSCQHKCGPLLGFMLQGMSLLPASCMPAEKPYSPAIIYEDDFLIAVDKPSGMLSEPGKNGDKSLPEYLEEYLRERHPGNTSMRILTVHRLDMDTSGIIIYAKSAEAQCFMQRQFERGAVRKTYTATLCPPAYSTCPHLEKGDKGTISLPIISAHEERPRQKADKAHGKPAVTEYEVLDVSPSGETHIIFRPLTGRTHQLRVHSAHREGLGRPIKGDLLYGGCSNRQDAPLRLHAASITFMHPATHEAITLSSASTPSFPQAE